jgi:PKD repeat protein
VKFAGQTYRNYLTRLYTPNCACMKHMLPPLSIFLFLMLIGMALRAQPLTSYQVSPTPTSQCSTTTVTINGFLPCGNATIQGTTHTYSGTNLFVDVFITQPLICLPIILPYSVTETVGNIPAGSYSLTVRYFENNVNLASLGGALTVGSCCSVNSAFTTNTLTGCPGDSLTFTAADPSLTSYAWTLGGNVISTSSVAGFTFPATGSFALSLAAGDGSCSTSTSQTIVIGQPQLAFGQVVGESCPGTQNGSIDLQVTGGATPYTYVWSNGGTTQDLTQLAAGTYSVTVTDINGCSAADSATVSVGIPVVAGIGTTSFSKVCTGASVSLSSTGTGETQYEWRADGLVFGQTQTVTYVFADTGLTTIRLLASNTTCSDTISQTFQVSAPLVDGSTTDESCTGSMDGTIDVTTTSGILPYSFLWSNGATTEDLTQVAGGAYVLTVVDSLGCITLDTLTVATSVGIDAQFSASGTSPICPGTVLDFTNTSTAGTTTAWFSDGISFGTNGNTTFAFPDSGSIEITLIATLGACADTASSVFAISAAPEVAALITNETCPESANGAIGLTLTGGATPFTYSWSNGASTEDLASLSAGTYDLLLTFGPACAWRDTFEIVTLGGLTAGFSHTQEVNGVQFTDLSDTTASSWAWDFGDAIGTSNAQNPLYGFIWPGNYEVCLIAADPLGCADTLCQTVTFTTGMEEKVLLSIAGYPNPVQSEYRLDLSSVTGQQVAARLYDSAGRLVLARQEQAEPQMTLQLGHLAPGLYHLLLTTDTGYFKASIRKE